MKRWCTFQVVSISQSRVRSLKNANLIHGIWNWIHGLVSLVKLFWLHFFFESHSPNTKAKTILIGDAHNILLRERETLKEIFVWMSFLRKSFSCMTTSLQDCISTANCQLTARRRRKTRKKGPITEAEKKCNKSVLDEEENAVWVVS